VFSTDAEFPEIGGSVQLVMLSGILSVDQFNDADLLLICFSGNEIELAYTIVLVEQACQ
jgi:hypothetical protein